MEKRPEIKTLLLGKVIAEDSCQYQNIYKDFYSGAGNGGEKFVTIGSFDAVSLYSPPPSPTNKDSWLMDLYLDRKQILRAASSAVCYHPIHLITWDTQDPAFDDCKHTFFVFSLLYGVGSTADPSGPNKSKDSIEQRTKAAIEQIKENLPLKDTHYRVYHAENMCDAVVLWKTEDMATVLEAVAILGRSGFVKKGFTAVSLRMDTLKEAEGGNKMILSSALGKIRGQKSCNYVIRIQGFIKDFSLFNDLLTGKNIFASIAKGHTFVNFGESDFTITPEPLEPEDFANLVQFFIEHSDEISEACLEIHTEIQLIDDLEPSKINYFPAQKHSSSSALCNFYADSVKRIVDNNTEKKHTPDYKIGYSWIFAFKELLNTHSNLDANPVLNSASYMYYYVTRILGDLVRNKVAGVQEEDIAWLLLENEQNIQDFFNAWTQLTDQITRMDDLVFQGFGNTPAIYNTLPTSMLDFFHAFLRRVADTLLSIDEKENIKPADFQYDFLIIPKLTPEVGIFNIFSSINPPTNWGRRIWPPRQLYLLDLPYNLVYHPKEFAIAIAHECAHMLGDTLRCRKYRADCMAAFAANQAPAMVGLLEQKYHPLLELIYKKFLSEVHALADYYFNDVQCTLQGSLNNFFQPDALYELYKELSEKKATEDLGKDLLAERILRQWNTGRYFSLMICDMMDYLFKESYADLIAVLLLGLEPDEYIQSFIISMNKPIYQQRQQRSNFNPVMLEQRIAVVLAVLCQTSPEEKIPLFKNEVISRERIIQTIYALQNPNYTIPWRKEEEAVLSALMSVYRYLKAAHYLYCKHVPPASAGKSSKVPAAKGTTDTLAEIYEKIFRKDRLFGEKFFQLIAAYHEEIDALTQVGGSG